MTPERNDAAARFGLTGPAGSRQRGALLRRLLATGDWIALIGALCLATATTSTTDVATLFWAVLFSPVWILVLKLHGLYDNDHRRIRHSTLDELPALISASALGTLALDGLLALSPAGPLSALSAILVGLGALIGSFTLRAVLRFAWHRLTGVATGVVVGSAAAARMVSRRVATHPEARLRLIGYLSPGDPAEGVGDPEDLPRLGSIDDISRVARDHDIERVVVTAQEMSEPTAERLIEQCKAAGLGLTLLPQHYGLLGPGIELNRLAELPVLDFRFSDPPWSTLMLKRALDIAVSATLLALLSPLLLVVSLLILLDSGRPVLFRQGRAGKDGEPFTMLKFRTMVADAEARLGELVDLEKLDEPVFKIPDDPRVHPRRALPAPHQPRRAAAADQRAHGRHVAGRAATRGGGRGRPLRRAPADPSGGEARPDRADAGLRPRRPHLRGAPGDGARLPRQPLGRRRPGDPAAHAERDRPRRRRLLRTAMADRLHSTSRS